MIMPKPSRPITVWIAVVLVAAVGTIVLLPFLFGMIMFFISEEPGYGTAIMARSAILLPPALGCWLSIIAIFRGMNWGRWLALISLTIVALEYWAFEILISTQWNHINTLTKAISYAFAMAFPIGPIIIVGALLVVGKRTSQYFSVASADPRTRLDPPSPPVFKE